MNGEGGVFYYLIAILIAFIVAIFVKNLLFWIILTFLALPISMKKSYDKPSKFYSKVFNHAYYYLISKARIKINFSGTDLIPQNQKFLFISNHRSNFDNMIHSYVLRDYPLAFISKKENFKIPIGRHFMNRCCYLSLDRGNIKQGIQTISRTINLIKSDATNIGVFPEGTRTKDGFVHEFKPGVFKIAKKASCPIVVGVTQGTQSIHKNWPWKKTEVNFDIIKVIYPEDFAEKSTIEIAEYCQNLVINHIKDVTQSCVHQ